MESSTANADEDVCDETQYVIPIFASLVAWQSGDINTFLQVINAKEYPSHLREAIELLVRKSQSNKVVQILNREIDCWIIIEAGHSRFYEWPNSKVNRKDLGLLSKIYENRLQYPHSTGDDEVDDAIKKILEKAQQQEE